MSFLKWAGDKLYRTNSTTWRSDIIIVDNTENDLPGVFGDQIVGGSEFYG
jgi:hypothetical protein